MKPDADYSEYIFQIRIPTLSSDSILVYRMTSLSKSNSKFDTVQIIVGSYSENITNCGEVDALKFDDINFDGYDDVLIYQGANKNCVYQNYDVWLFDPKGERFVFNEEFSNIASSNYDANEDTKTITTSYINYQDYYEYAKITYKVINGKPTLIERLSRNYDFNGLAEPSEKRMYIWKHEKLVKGYFKVIEQTTKSQKDLEKEEQ
jgi:hypothetical protein